MKNLARAITFTSKWFEDRLDKGGQPYILHCLYVMNGVAKYNDPELMQIAVMHDVLEDIEYVDEKLLRNLDFSNRVVDGVLALTKNPDEPYDDYIARVCANIDAVKVKLVDIEHNTQLTRLKGLRQKDFDRNAKYLRTFVKLQEVLRNHG